jgi:hypothetical protein
MLHTLFYLVLPFQDKGRALAISTACQRLFQHLFEFRKRSLSACGLTTVEAVESHLIETFLTLMLKLSLDDFKPIFYRLFNLSYSGELRMLLT